MKRTVVWSLRVRGRAASAVGWIGNQGGCGRGSLWKRKEPVEGGPVKGGALLGGPVEGLEGLPAPVLESILGFRGVKFVVPWVMMTFGHGNGFWGTCWMVPLLWTVEPEKTVIEKVEEGVIRSSPFLKASLEWVHFAF